MLSAAFWEVFLSALVTFFVVIDPPGTTPIFASLTQGAPRAWVRAMALRSVFVAAIIILFFGIAGAGFLSAIGISMDAFRAAGGVMLFLIALEMVFEKRTERREERTEKFQEEHGNLAEDLEDISVFPLAIPLLAGPGSIATIMLFISQQSGNTMGQAAIWAAVGANLLLCLVLFFASGAVMRLMGKTFAASITRVLGVILAALATQLIFDAIKATFLT